MRLPNWNSVKLYSLSLEGVREEVVVCRQVTAEALKNKINLELASAHKAHVSHIHNNNNITCKRTVAKAVQREQSKCRISRILPFPWSKGFREAEVGCTVVTEETLKEI